MYYINKYSYSTYLFFLNGFTFFYSDKNTYNYYYYSVVEKIMSF